MKGPTKQLNKLLFSSSHHEEEDHNESQEHSNSFNNIHYDELDQCENKYNFQNHQDNWRSNDQVQFLQYNGHSVEFSQNFSQNSMMMASNRQDDDSRDYKLEGDKRYKKILQRKQKQEIEFNVALDMELSSIKQELEKSKFEVSRLQSALKGCQLKVLNKVQEIQEQENTINQLEEEIQKLKYDKAECMQSLEKKDGFFCELRTEINNLYKEGCLKDKEIAQLRKINNELSEEIDRLHRSLSIYTEPDRKLFDFKGHTPQYESLTNSKKNSNSDKIQKDLEKVKKDKNALQIELGVLKEKLEDRQNRFRVVEEDTRKKNTLKERRIQQLEQKITELKEQSSKIKNQYESNIQKLNASLTSKNKEISSLGDKIIESEKRIKSLLEDGKKKDEKARDLNLQVIEKNKMINEKDKELQDMRIKQEFDHHLVSEKDKEIQKLIQTKKQIEQQMESERDRKDKAMMKDKNDKNDKMKWERQLQRQKKELQATKKAVQTLQKEKEELLNNLKDAKRKLDQSTKKFQQLKASHTELQSQLKNKDSQSQSLKETTQKILKELNQSRKKAESVPELKNKIIILQSRLKQNETLMRESSDLTESLNLHDQIQALQLRLEQKDKQVKNLRNMLQTNNMQTSDQQEEDFYELQFQLAERQKIIDRLEAQLHAKDQIIHKMSKEIEFKNSTLQYTHKKFVDCEKQKIQLEQEKKILQEMIEHNSFDEQNFKEIRFYEQKVETLQNKLSQAEKRLREKQENERTKDESIEYKFENRRLRQRIKQLNDALLSKQRKITPETMSQEDTVIFLIKTIKKVNRSADMQRLLMKNQQFNDVFIRMQKQFHK